MTYGSICSGIEAASVAWEPLGWKAAWFSETEDFPSKVLAFRYPGVPNLGDMRQIYEKKEFKETGIDLLVGGTPCQSYSIAGRRGGLDDPRGDLALEFLRIAGCAHPRWVVWENVPGALSTHGGRDFGIILWALAKLGYGFAYRVLDAQFFGVPQRRRRVFLVGYQGDWRRAAAVLFERESIGRNCKAPPKSADRVAATIKAGIYKGWNDLANVPNLCSGGEYGRRLTVEECERLQGFPAGYTNIPGASVSRRLKAAGNSMAVPVMRWIGKRIQFVDSLKPS